MSKSKKQVLMSPENYIRQKSRNLPIVRCLINKKWKDEGLANISIVRRHSNGNYTFCAYLVDLDCLGVKDTTYRFNAPQEALDEYEAIVGANYPNKEISYDLAHNIIFAAVEFAEEYGFKPHKDFTSVTQYFLEKDDDNIPLIEIHCGDKNGKPIYINNGDETPALQQHIINQLEKTAGKGNFEVYINDDEKISDKDEFDDEYEFEFDDEDDMDEDDEIYYYWYEKFAAMDGYKFNRTRKILFMKWIIRSRTIDYHKCKYEELFNKMRALTDILSGDDMYSEDKIAYYYDKITNDLENIETVDIDKVPNSLFPTFVGDGLDVASDLFETFLKIHSNPKNKETQKKVAKFALKYNDCGAFAYLKFLLNSKTKANKWEDIEKELEKFPNYFMLQLLQKEIETSEMSPEQTRKELLDLAKNRTLTIFEMSQLLMDYAVRVFEIADTQTPDHLDKLKALEKLFDHDFTDEKCDYTSSILLTMVRILKINHIVTHIVNKIK
jgi:hypothetical protein